MSDNDNKLLLSQKLKQESRFGIVFVILLSILRDNLIGVRHEEFHFNQVITSRIVVKKPFQVY